MSRQASKREPKQPEWQDTSVDVTYLHPGTVEGAFHQSLLMLLMDDAYGPRIVKRHLPIQSGANIVSARNKQARTFLKGDSEWMLCLDSDMKFDPDTIYRLLEVADPVERPIMGGLCFGLWRGQVDRVFATLYMAQWKPYQTERLEEWPENTVLQVNATGAACLLIHRDVLEKMGAEFPEPWPWFAESVIEGQHVSEDFTFCYRAQQLGYPIHVHTGVEVGHVKPVIVNQEMFDRWTRPPLSSPQETEPYGETISESPST